MASPQKENGHTQISNEYYDELIKACLSGSEYQVMLFLIRKTWGWNKKSDRISYSQIAEATGIHRSTAIRVIESLDQKGLIKKDCESKNLPAKITPIKDYEKWSTSSRTANSQTATPPSSVMATSTSSEHATATSSGNATPPSSEYATHKRHITKDNKDTLKTAEDFRVLAIESTQKLDGITNVESYLRKLNNEYTYEELFRAAKRAYDPMTGGTNVDLLRELKEYRSEQEMWKGIDGC